MLWEAGLQRLGLITQLCRKGPGTAAAHTVLRVQLPFFSLFRWWLLMMMMMLMLLFLESFYVVTPS